ncbi:ComEC/Rec2 family competence protein [Vibrio splendidus]
MIEIKMYPAKKGDAFLVSFGTKKEINILIDMGFIDTYQNHIKHDLIELNKKGRSIDLLVITHIDQDHIQGAIKFFEENGSSNNIIEVKEVWHNSYRHLQFDKNKEKIDKNEKAILNQIKLQNLISYQSGALDASAEQGSTLAALLYKNNENWNGSFDGLAVCRDNKKNINIADVSFKLISPGNEKLKELAIKWADYLDSCKYNFSLSEDEIFDDAYELFIQHNDEIEYEHIESSNIDELPELSKLLEDNPKQKDNSETNGSSISFILEYKGTKLLFLGDAHDDEVTSELSKLNSSGYALDFEVVKISHHGSKNNTSNKFIKLINANKFLISTSGLKHPDLEVVAKIATADYPKEIITNYLHKKLDYFENDFIKKKYNYKMAVKRSITIEVDK